MFRTEFKIELCKTKIKPNSNLMFLGSCFTENIGKNISDLYLHNIINPFGILYNPASVSENLRILINKTEFNETDLEFNNDKWASYNHHGKFSDENKNTCLQNINNELNKSNKFIRTTDILFITFGTSWVYKLKENNKIVANCHKIPTKYFVRERLTISEIVEDYSSLIEELKTINPNIKIVFTVSPIRHWKDGANGNQLSKSILLLAIEEIVKQNSNSVYFPSYEIVMDDLRDYRFYASDMLHINETAINYIWDKFKEAFFDEAIITYSKKIEKINNVLNHRAEDNTNSKYIDLINSNIVKSHNLEKEFDIDLYELIIRLKAKLV